MPSLAVKFLIYGHVEGSRGGAIKKSFIQGVVVVLTQSTCITAFNAANIVWGHLVQLFQQAICGYLARMERLVTHPSQVCPKYLRIFYPYGPPNVKNWSSAWALTVELGLFDKNW
eukprot:Gb_22210 [translate_table: standard]